MQHILVIVDKYFPNPSSNGACAKKIVDSLMQQGNEVTVLSVYYAGECESRENKVCLCKTNLKVTMFHKLFGYLQDASLVKELFEAAKKIHKEKPINKVFSVYRSIEAVLCGEKLQEKFNILHIPCFFDIPETSTLSPVKKKIMSLNYKRLFRQLCKQGKILTLKYYYDYFVEKTRRPEQIKKIGIPNFVKNQKHTENKGKIKIVYTGSFYEEIRNPKKVFDVLSKIANEDIEIHLYSWGCEKVVDEYKKIFKERLIVHGRVDIETAQTAISQADVLLNISNDAPLQVPGKVLEYFSTGKPVINFCFRKDDSGKEEYNKYPLNYNVDLFEKVDIEGLSEFVLSSRGAKADIDKLYNLYEDCTPEYVAGLIGG